MDHFEKQVLRIAEIYVPSKRQKMLNAETVSALAQSILEEGQKTPILVRQDGDRFVLIEGLHRLEALKSLGETTIIATLGQARRH
jgi:ParB-like chromosome segregation protein Spo0J